MRRSAIGAKFGRSIFERGLTFGSTGNISVSTDDGFSHDADRRVARRSRSWQDFRRSPSTGRTKASTNRQGVVSPCRDVEEPGARGRLVHLHSTHSDRGELPRRVDAKNLCRALTAIRDARRHAPADPLSRRATSTLRSGEEPRPQCAHAVISPITARS